MKKMRSFSAEVIKTNRLREGLLILSALMLPANSLFAQVTNIAQLDEACVFSFAAYSDSRGEVDEHCERAFGWMKENHDFVLGVGDILGGEEAKDEATLAMWRNDPFWHDNMYPTFGNHCSIIHAGGRKGSQTEWGRPYFTLTNLNLIGRSGVEFREPGSEMVHGWRTKADQLAGILQTNYYADQYTDYYVQRSFGAITVHLVIVYKQDRGAFFPASSAFLYNKVMEIGAEKTEHDLVILAAHDERWFWRSAREDYDFCGYTRPFTAEQLKEMLSNSDLILCASDHRFRRCHEEDSFGITNGALVVNTGQVLDLAPSDGYCEFHVFDNPLRFTSQYINADSTVRTLHTGRANNGAIDIKPERGETEILQCPMLKTVDGAIVQPLDWSTFAVLEASNPIACSKPEN